MSSKEKNAASEGKNGGNSLGGAERAYSEIRRRILSLEFPPSMELEEGHLVALLHLSRTPVREALIRLASEGLVTIQRGRGARVAPLDLANLRSFFEALDLIQRAITKLAAIRHEPEDLTQIEKELKSFEVHAADEASLNLTEANHRFHLAIAAAARNPFLEHAYNRVMCEGLRIIRVCYSEHYGEIPPLKPHLERTVEDHRQIFEAIRNREAEKAEELAGEHNTLFRNRVSQTLAALSPSTRGIHATEIPEDSI
ncbi:GntR family transcriptional regulator [Fodinicurvata fenggangensis]|uniref:GntR family transcriptional regulator n=1 Tax=Fodinicurvata fenggangensis TaxID=1121830 RepID=UPI0009DFC111|nr:GntR family transcriptional regulator [Fodinicurvata fenggangensis]